MIDVFYLKIDPQYFSDHLDELCAEFHDGIRQWILSFKHPHERYRRLAGRLLLKRLLATYGIDLNTVVIDTGFSGKPVIKHSDIDFNISHSRMFAICAVSTCCKVGIDIQHKRKINLPLFEKHMTKQQWHDITNSDDSIDRFFYYWTLKESVLKADGIAIANNLLNVITADGKTYFNNTVWHVATLTIENNYSCHLASNKPINTVQLNQISLKKGL